jgi:hypothetical protein
MAELLSSVFHCSVSILFLFLFLFLLVEFVDLDSMLLYLLVVNVFNSDKTKNFAQLPTPKKITFKYKKAKNKAMIILMILLYSFRGIQYL